MALSNDASKSLLTVLAEREALIRLVVKFDAARTGPCPACGMRLPPQDAGGHNVACPVSDAIEWVLANPDY